MPSSDPLHFSSAEVAARPVDLPRPRSHVAGLRCAPPTSWAVLVGALIAALVALNLGWLWRTRLGFPLTIDEAGYLAIALDNRLAWLSDGADGLWNSFQQQSLQAPLVMLLTVPAHLLLSDGVLAGFLVIQVFYAVTILSTYALGRRLATPAAGVLAAFVIGTAPGIIDYARMYHFALPSTALFVAATYALLASDGLRRTRWTLLWGVLLGLALLSRTLMIALVPPLMVVAGWQALSRRTEGDRRVRNLLLGIATATAVAALWYARNLGTVLGYLLDSGYGSTSAYMGRTMPVVSLDFWLARLGTLVAQGLFLPLAVLLLLSLVSALPATMSDFRGARGVRDAATAALRSDAGQVLAILAGSYLALTSSRNTGTGFVLPLVPLVVALGVAALQRVARRWIAGVAVAGFVLVACFNVVMAANVAPALSEPRIIHPPALGELPIVDGRGYIRRYLQTAGHAADPVTSPLPAVHRQWSTVDRRVATFLADYAAARGRHPIVFFASKDPVFNSNSVRLASNMHLPRLFELGDLTSSRGDHVRSYTEQLNAPPFRPNFLITTPPGPAELRPVVTQTYAEIAAKRLGFTLRDTFRLPDGRTTRIWWAPRGEPLRADERVRLGYLRNATVTLDPGRPRRGRRLVTGILTDSSGARLGGSPVRLTARPLTGPGAWGTYTFTGTVPPRASVAVVAVRVNAECDCRGPSDVAIREARYVESPTAGNLVPNGDFADGLRGWTFSGTALLQRDSVAGHGGITRVVSDAAELALLNSAAFPVRAGSAFELSVTSRVSAGSEGTGYFAVLFLGREEVLRERIPFRPAPVSKGSTTTREDGTYQADLRDLPEGQLLIEAVFPGDSLYWPARARRIVHSGPGELNRPLTAGRASDP